MQENHQAALQIDALALGWQLFESSPDCVKLLDSNGRILAMNEPGLRAMEIDDFSRFSGALWSSLWPSASHAEIEAALRTAVAGGTGHVKAFCPTAKGSPRWWDVIVSPVAGREHGSGQLLVVSRDVTAAHNAALDIAASEARFRSLVMASSAIVWTCTAPGRFETEQPAWAAFTGQRFDQYRETGWLDAVHPDDRAGTAAAWARAIASPGIYEVRHRLRGADGRYRHMAVKAVPVRDPAGRLIEWVGTDTDITNEIEVASEREHLLKEVQMANRRLNDVFRQAPAFMCVLSGPDHVFELINDRYLELVGQRDLVGQPIRAALPELVGQGLLEPLDRVYQTGEPYFGVELPVLLQRAPGMPLDERFLDLACMVLHDADGGISGLLVHGVDQSARKLAGIALHETRERFEKIVNQAATGVMEMDIAGRITFANQHYADMLGYSIDELLGLGLVDVTAPASLGPTLDAADQLLLDGVGFVIDKEYRRKDSSHMPATSSVNLLRGPDGDAQGMVAIVLDTTATKRAADQLRASEERYRTLFESMDQGFCIVEIIFDEQHVPVDYRFGEMNEMFQRHTGLADATGKTVRELVPDLDRFWIDTYGGVALTGEAVRFESEARAMHRWFDVYATRIGGAGSSLVALLFSDITARKAADETLRALAADLSEADRRKTEFLATLAHELRNPLAPIRSGLGVMRLTGDNPATVARVREMMERQVGHMVHLIDDLLDVARISGGKLELKKVRVDLKTVLASAIETSLPVIEAGKHVLRVDLPEAALDAEVDVTRIAQVVANLLNNAAKYTPAGGRILLSAARDGDDALIVVTDNGVGIPADALSSVFDMFSQVGRHLDRAQGGLGIGLSLVRRLVEMHGGEVGAASAGHDAGSSFTVRLPLAGAAPQAASDHAPSAASPVVHAVKALVVDDNVDAAVTLAMLLDVGGHSTRVAHNGLEAMAVVADFTPDVVFLDIGMPGMNGYETARAMRAVPGLAGVCLVALTGWGADADRSRSSEAGFDHHLTKPVQMAAVERILAGLNA